MTTFYLRQALSDLNSLARSYGFGELFSDDPRRLDDNGRDLILFVKALQDDLCKVRRIGEEQPSYEQLTLFDASNY